jgi:hypothetical protein
MHQGSLVLPPTAHWLSEVQAAPGICPAPGTTQVDWPIPQYSTAGMQLVQATPPAPHWVSPSAGGGQAVSGTQVLPAQQPLQVAGPHPAAVQMPFKQVVAPTQAAQATPAAPHWELLSLATGTQVLPLQQPMQLDGPQGVMHTPL